jgi:hypothetical protein
MKESGVREMSSVLLVAVSIMMVIIPVGVMIWFFILKDDPDRLDSDR